MSKIPRELLKVDQEVWLVRDEQISKFLVNCNNKDGLVLSTLDRPAKYMVCERGDLYGSEKDARIALIQQFEEDLQVRERRLSAARAGLNQFLREHEPLGLS